MNLSRLLICAVLVFIAGSVFTPFPVSAQGSNTKTDTDTARFSPFVSATIGIGSLGGATFVDRGKIAGELMVGLQRVHRPRISHVAGLVLGAFEWRGGHDASCAIAIGGGCVPIAPETRFAAVVLGAQLRSRVVSVAGMAGPGVFRVGNRAIFSGRDPNGTTIYGTVLRADVWFRVVKHLEVGGSASTRIMPAYRHNRISANSISTGLRAYW